MTSAPVTQNRWSLRETRMILKEVYDSPMPSHVRMRFRRREVLTQGFV